jgi:LuxR family maltose regulon positive regulatory protein
MLVLDDYQMSTQRHQGTADFIQSFAGSHHFVLDYLIEKVLQQQPEHIQTFLLRTSILDRLCASLCDAVNSNGADGPMGPDETPVGKDNSQTTLEYLERANLFIIPLDNERRWYRYHHLFAGFLRQRTGQSLTPTEITKYHIRASQWYEENEFGLEAFHHATAVNDIERAEQLINQGIMPLHFRGTVTAILNWLESLPKTAQCQTNMIQVKQPSIKSGSQAT